MSGHTRKDLIPKDCIRGDIGVASIKEKLIKTGKGGLNFGHVQTRSLVASVRRVDSMDLSLVKRGRGVQKERCNILLKAALWSIILVGSNDQLTYIFIEYLREPRIVHICSKFDAYDVYAPT